MVLPSSPKDDYDLEYLTNHIFFPPQLPQADDSSPKNDNDICRVVLEAAREYQECLPIIDKKNRWPDVIAMLDRFCSLYLPHRDYTEERLTECIHNMNDGGVAAFLIRAQNVGLIIRKLQDRTVFESFEVSAPNETIMTNRGKLNRSFPGPAIAVPSSEANKHDFVCVLGDFLVQMNGTVIKDAMPTTTKAGSNTIETRDIPHPGYITELLTGILRGIGRPEDVQRFTKRIADDILWDNALLPWRRSPLWLVIRVALQSCLGDKTSGSHETYKSFMAFLMSRILRRVVIAEFDSDILSIMHKKLARRVYKLGEAAPSFLLDEVTEVGKRVLKVLKKRWDVAQNEDAFAGQKGWQPSRLDPSGDTALSLDTSKAYISTVLKGQYHARVFSGFDPSEQPRLKGKLEDYTADGILRKLGGLGLFDFERAVEEEIDDWVSNRLTLNEACLTIWKWIEEYHRQAQDRYSGNPDGISVMYLTLLDLWIGLDKLCVAQCPLLLDYSPEMVETIFEPLLLRRPESIERLKKAFLHLRYRHARSKDSDTIFSDSISSSSFSVRFFDSCTKLQNLKQEIESQATRDRQKKVQELEKQNTRYDDLRKKYRAMDCDLWENWRTGRRQHDRNCEKCRVQREYESMKILIFEWPLPSRGEEAKAAVFEIACPTVFGVWRQATYHILLDICTPAKLRPDSVPAKVELSSYDGLCRFVDHCSVRRLSLASSTKSWTRTHYKEVSLPSEEGEVCKTNGLRLSLYDLSTKVWVSSRFARDCTIDSECTYKLPTGPYSNLQKTLYSTLHTTNDILASQFYCHPELSLHEYIAFGSLRAGERLQWGNILREIHARTLTFSQDAVEMLIAQSALQIGSLSKERRWKWHEEILNPEFRRCLLEELEDLLVSIQPNWSEAATMRTIILLARCVLTWSTNDEICQTFLGVLRDCRRVAYGWMKNVGERLKDINKDNDAQEFQLRLCEMAATCRSTCDVGSRWYRRACVEDQSSKGHSANSETSRQPSSLTMVLEAGMVLRDNMPLDLASANVSQVIRQLLARDDRFSHSFEQFLASAIIESNDILHEAIRRYWPAYSRTPESSWCQLPAPNDRWLCLRDGTQPVHFNVLQSQLLVEGKPIGRLPSKFVSHLTYQRIFGQTILDVVPPDQSEPGVEFATKDLIKVKDPKKLGYQVFFAYNVDKGELIIKATCRDTNRRFELIPHTKLLGDLPQFLVEDYTHWLSLDDEVIELRPRTDIWNTYPANWHIVFTDSHSYMCREPPSGFFRLVDVRSQTASMLSSRLQPLEKSNFMTMIYSINTHDVTVELPRYRLSFRLNPDGQLLCSTLPNMAVDDNQTAGVMIGLANKLVLRNMKCDARRELLLPLGRVDFSKHENTKHTEVTIDIGSQRRVSYFRYTIDDLLGRLSGNTSLHARLYRLYLTAVTSSCLPNPLTERTGTQEALAELKSASCRSFITLDKKAQDLLHKFAELSPRRSYYPEHLKVMQRVEWRDLPSLAQHDEFYEASRTILDFARRLQVFPGERDPKPVQVLSSLPAELLLQRAAARNLWFYPPEFHFECPKDLMYCSRDIPDSSAENLVFSNSSLVRSWPARLSTTLNLLQWFEKWSNLSGSAMERRTVSHVELNGELADIWMLLYNHLRSKSTNLHQVLFTLCSLAYFHKSSDVQSLIPTLLAFATNREHYRNLDPPQWNSYTLSKGFEPDRDSLIGVAENAAKGFNYNDYTREVPSRSDENYWELESRRRMYYDKQLESEAKTVVDFVVRQWPCLEPSAPMQTSFSLIMVQDFMSKARSLFADWYHNWDLRNHVNEVQRHLDIVRDSSLKSLACVYKSEACLAMASQSRSLLVSLHDLFEARMAPLCLDRLPSTLPGRAKHDCRNLQSLVDELKNSTQNIHHTYAEGLQGSLDALGSMHQENGLPTYRKECENHFSKVFKTVQHTLSNPTKPIEEILQQANLWPAYELHSVLQSMASITPFEVPATWIEVLRHLARSLILCQRSRRLLCLAQLEKGDDLEKELNVDESVLAVKDFDWLLIQVDNDFLVRKVQLAVAQEMTSPSSGENTLLQLNMGEGKSSVIVPFVAAALADGEKLLRVVVLKSLAGQMFSLLQQRLGGLVNRPILYLPFSRDVKMGRQEAIELQELYEDAVRDHAIIVAQPEHLLSFKLMAVDKLVEKNELSKQLIKTQLWLDDQARDVLDESDEILHTRYQLIYTVGAQQTLELGSNRWRTIQGVLSLVKECAQHVQDSIPLGLEIGQSDNQFPQIRVLKHEAGERLVSEVRKKVMDSRLESCSFERFPSSIGEIAERFIANETLSHEERAFFGADSDTDDLWKKLLLLRGLLGQGILVYVLQQRRWRVDFGLDLARSLLAVPYRAKDVPSLRAEFGHPDVAILLTCLSYLYGGLSQAELETSFQLLFRSDNRTRVYEDWVRAISNVPDDLRNISGVNLRDTKQFRDTISPLFRMNPATIDFYLSQVVFPKAAKEFPKKLTTTGWDLARRKKHVTTGFSGTNDNRHLLPTSIAQVDTTDRIGTNASMLSLLLAPENNHYERLSVQVRTGQEIIDAIVGTAETPFQPDIRVLLDVGAQILGLSNLEVAKYWLSKRPNLQAAVFFNEHDELEVLHNGTSELLSLSPFHDNFDQCVVYLDDAHTRGTDLKLPTNWRACVTLGPKVTKDRLAQGCMRMRKLGRGQTVVFMAPRDVDSAIRARAGKGDEDIVESRDVVRWAMLETCADIQHHVPHWVQQGVDFTARDEGWKDLVSSEDPLQAREALTSSWLQPEARTLQEMYGKSSSTDDNSLTMLARKRPEIWNRCKQLGVTEIQDPRIEEEQEREVSHEMETERQIERPPKAEPATHVLHPDVKQFVESGVVPVGSSAFDNAFPPLRVSAGSTEDLRWKGSTRAMLIATRDFLDTIKPTSKLSVSDYLRPVNWVVSSCRVRCLVILSPFEVNELLPTIRQSEHVRLHVYTPRITQFMQPVDDLRLYSFRLSSDAWLGPEQEMVDQLNLCAGQLYFSDYDAYCRISALLGVPTPKDAKMKSENDGFVKPENRADRLLSNSRSSSPLEYLRLLVGSRRKGISFEATHLGKVLGFRFLVPSEFDSEGRSDDV